MTVREAIEIVMGAIEILKKMPQDLTLLVDQTDPKTGYQTALEVAFVEKIEDPLGNSFVMISGLEYSEQETDYSQN